MNTRHVAYYGLLAFLAFAILFSTFRKQVSAVNSWILTISGDLSIRDFKATSNGEQDSLSPKKLAASLGGTKIPGQKTISSPTAAKPAFKFDIPQTSDLPKTEQPSVLFITGEPTLDDTKAPVFPELRKFDGTEWTTERTELRMMTDGKFLFVIGKCYDQKPDEIVTQFSETSGASMAWKDDSVEFFIMKDKSAKFYAQYITSASGKGSLGFYKIPEDGNPRSMASANKEDLPKEIITPVFDAKRNEQGYLVYMKINLSNLDIKKLDVGDEFLIQFVRNYRGQGTPGATILQLFPVYIYGDNRYGVSNHDRRTFQPVKVIK